MKLEKILDNINSLEKNAFLKIVDSIISSNPKNAKGIEQILSESSSEKCSELKNIDSINIARIFELIHDEFSSIIKTEFLNTSSQFDILIDIIIRDGNCILKPNWLAHLYDDELKKIKEKTKALKAQLEKDNGDIDANRKRDYDIYRACVEDAYFNDTLQNRDPKITDEELSILVTLSKKIDLSQEEIKLINYLIIPPEKKEIEDIILLLKSVGVVFYSKKNNLIYVADEIVRVLRSIRRKEVADKFYRRVLKALTEPQINNICRKHNIESRGIDLDVKIKEIAKEGVLFSNCLINSMHKQGASLTERKKAINDLWEKSLKIPTPLRGVTIEEKVDNIINHFDNIEKDERVGISIDGYDKLLVDLQDTLPNFIVYFIKAFQMPDDIKIESKILVDYNIKPRDVLDVLPDETLKKFIETKGLKNRGDFVQNILDAYKDTENLLIENYEHIGNRNLSSLKENGIIIKESDLGIKFEKLTKNIFENLGFNVDESLRKQISNAKNQVDILLNLGNNDVIIIECKTVKEKGYNKFSTVSRQIKAYIKLAEDNNLNVVKSLLVAPDFSDDFINECDLEFEINLSLITAKSLVEILEGFKNSKLKQFPFQLLLKDVLIKEDRILKAINK